MDTEFINSNILIANFMGVLADAKGYLPTYKCMDLVFQDDTGSYYYDGNLYYHKSWDWLMPAVEKIESLGYRTEIHSNSTLIFDGDVIVNPPYGYGEQSTRIDATYRAVVAFIEEYNKNINNETTDKD